MRTLTVLGGCHRRAALALALLIGSFAQTASGQITPGDTIPTNMYFRTLPLYFDGDYREALAAFQAESRGSIKAPGQWIDAICYYTMAGESAYQLGNLPLALENYNAGLKLFVAYSDWMMRVQFPLVITPGAANAAATPWGQSRRGARPGVFPTTFLMGQGQIDNSQVIMRGGVMQQAILFPVNVAEIVRTTSLAIRRRREILGPLAKFDSVTNDVLDVLSRRPGPPNHWSEAWVNIQLGCAQAAAGNTAQAVATLEKGLLVNGEMDHPLTSTGLVELGKLALESGDYPAATTLFEEASYAAFQFPDWGNLEESLHWGFIAHLLSNQKTAYPPLSPALSWARAQGSRHLQASLMLSAAESVLAQGETAAASNFLATCRTVIGRNDLSNSYVGARLNHLSATAAYQAGNVQAGDQAIQQALVFQRSGSLWLHQMREADSQYLGGILTDRNALSLYDTMLRDPTPADWSANPLECLSVLCTPHEAVLEHWFDMSLKNTREHDAALEIADRIRRHRFFSSLPLGGRILSVRWILEGPPELVGERGLLERQDLLARYPHYRELAARALQIQTQLTSKPAVPEAVDARKEQTSLLTSLADVSQQQEIILREIAVRREPAEMVFPPLRKTKDIQAGLDEGQVLLAFLRTSKQLHGFLYSPSKYAVWKVASPAGLEKQIATMLRDMGNYDANHEVNYSDLQKASWRPSAAKVMSMLFDKSNVDLAGNFQELVIVPDDFLWYLPFEALPIGKPDKQKLLLWHSRVRYAPTAGLSIPYSRVQKPAPTVGVALGRLYPQQEDTVAIEAFEQLSKAVPGSVAIPRAMPAPSSIYRTMFDQWIVLDDIAPGDGPYDWTPAHADRGKGGSGVLANWLMLPMGGPSQMILPGYHTSAESGMRKSSAPGSELFLSLCGLMSSGVRTILISRWRTGGQTSFDLVREFAQELPHVSPAEAWQRSVELAADSQLEPAREPRLNKKGMDAADPPDAKHPFFWAGYLLVDPGTLPAGDDRALTLPGLGSNRGRPANPTLVPAAGADPGLNLRPTPPPPKPDAGEPGNAKAKAVDNPRATKTAPAGKAKP